MNALQLVRVAGQCPDGNTCPTGFVTNRGSVVIQGPTVSSTDLPDGMAIPPGEAAVEISLELLQEIARAVRS